MCKDVCAATYKRARRRVRTSKAAGEQRHRFFSGKLKTRFWRIETQTDENMGVRLCETRIVESLTDFDSELIDTKLLFTSLNKLVKANVSTMLQF